MAESLIRMGSHVETRIWTLVITLGRPFQLRLPMNPLLEHDGVRTIWKLHGTSSDVEAAKIAIEETSGAEVTFYTEEQTAEQRYERMELLGLDEGPLL